MLHHAKQRAKRFNVPITIGLDDIVIPTHCPVFGIELKHGVGSGGFKDHSPTLDRIRPELGYVKSNIVVLSWRANRIKCDGTLEEILKIATWMRTVGW
jgi:hypothetical protein